MEVLPDAIPYITPTVDLQLSFGEGKGFDDHTEHDKEISKDNEGQGEDVSHDYRRPRHGGNVLAGCFVPSNYVCISKVRDRYVMSLTFLISRDRLLNRRRLSQHLLTLKNDCIP